MSTWPLVAGSSLRARGALVTFRRLTAGAGIIPACAGSTPAAAGRWSWRGDHPRVRGEHVDPGRVRQAMEGSSPRARGAPDLLRVFLQGHGIIPACAGSTHWVEWAKGRKRDHPRVRGEHAGPGGDFPEGQGSSPRARGAPAPGPCAHPSSGIIPACAGSTSGWTSTLTGSGDHPRVRGEHIKFFTCSRTLTGSSPRARGAHAALP